MKKVITLILASLMLVFAFAACGNPEPEADEPITGGNIVNPLSEETAENLLDKSGFDLSGISKLDENAKFFYIEADPAISEARFTLDGCNYTYRLADTAEYTDISGVYNTWSTTESSKVGYCDATAYVSDDGTGVILWYDVAPGVQYSLSTDSGASVASLTAAATKVFAPTQGDAAGDIEEPLRSVLSGILENYEVGTAGADLKGAALAAELADTFAQFNADADKISTVVESFCGSLAADDKALFTEQAAGIADLFKLLNGETGATLLGDCGYESACYPWDAATLTPLFDAFAAAAGVQA